VFVTPEEQPNSEAENGEAQYVLVPVVGGIGFAGQYRKRERRARNTFRPRTEEQMKCASIVTVFLGGIAMTSAQPPGTTADTKNDTKFLKAARSGGQFEVQASKMALQRATDPAVKQFAQRMVDDHTKIGAELDQIAPDSSRSTTQLDPVHAAMLNKLSQEQGKEFDECYIGMQVLAHEEALMCFRKAKKGEDPKLRAFAEKNIPVLREHLQMARKMSDQRIDGGLRETLKPDGNR
jgi:putative membrane protein